MNPRLPFSAQERHPGIIDVATPVTVAVDGPSGSGKSTVSRALALGFDLAYLDTGAMFRAVTWAALDQGIELADAASVAAFAREVRMVQSTDPSRPEVRVAGREISRAIRESRITAKVSAVATNLDVRAELAHRQREIIQEARTHRGIVAEGRDITTVIAPQAEVRVLLTADEEARLARRQRQTSRRSGDITRATRDEVLRRDRDDATVSTFHTAADGVTTVDTSGLDLLGSIEAVAQVVLHRAGAPAGASNGQEDHL